MDAREQSQNRLTLNIPSGDVYPAREDYARNCYLRGDRKRELENYHVSRTSSKVEMSLHYSAYDPFAPEAPDQTLEKNLPGIAAEEGVRRVCNCVCNVHSIDKEEEFMQRAAVGWQEHKHVVMMAF